MTILVFDSGVGGLTVAQAIRKRLPELGLCFAADDDFRPYGNKSRAQLQDRLPGLIASLAEMSEAQLVVLACNTASTTALDEVRAAVDIPVVGVVPAIKPAAKVSPSKVIGLLGTPGTVSHPYVDQLISEFASDCQVVRLGSTALVEWAEAKLAGEPVSMPGLRRELSAFSDTKGLDTVVLACTHFPLLYAELQDVLPDIKHWIDSGDAIARRVDSLLGGTGTRGAADGHAFLIGPDTSARRKAAFAAYGFDKVIPLRR